jgi:hypothetical protein
MLPAAALRQHVPRQLLESHPKRSGHRERRRFGAWAAAFRCIADGLLDDVEDVAR